jgi:transcriptional regulator with PAS, ATPase and Fis domain
MNLLVTWLGHTDLRYFGLDGASEEMQARICEIVRDKGSIRPQGDGVGPVRTLLANQSFDQIHFLSNYPEDLTAEVVKWTGADAKVHPAVLENPSDYREVYAETDRLLGEVCGAQGDRTFTLHLLLSPGTPTMAANMVLLGKTRYPAEFWQTWRDKVTHEQIPFDLTMDLVPELLRGADNRLQHLAALAPEDVEGFESVIGSSKAIRLAVGRARKAALRDVPVLLTGESGSGKEVFARAIHKASHRRGKKFRAINCAAIPDQLLESELFGHSKDAFTGATRDKDGAFTIADGGTIFLDEVGELKPEIQAKLLRVLQPPLDASPCTREFSPVGSAEVLRTNVRVVAATNRDLLQMIRDGQFREDLFYRLAVISVKLPPLRERRSDIVHVANSLLTRINADFAEQEPGYKNKMLSKSAKVFMTKHNWSGNVRELYNALIQAAVMTEDDVIQEEDLSAAVVDMPSPCNCPDEPSSQSLGNGFSIDQYLDGIRGKLIQRAMNEAEGVKTRAFKLLGLKSYQTLDGQIKRLKLDL